MQMNNNKLRVATIQMPVTLNKADNLHTAVRMIRDAVQRYQPHLVVLPENFTTPYGKQYFMQHAEIIPGGETYTVMSQLAKELQIYLVAGSIPELDAANKQMLYNTAMVFGRNGDLIAKYRKLHLFNAQLSGDHQMMQSDYMKAGAELGFFVIDGIKIGLGIGYDMSFAELAQMYRKNDVRMMVYVASFPTYLGYEQWEQLNRARAIDNQMMLVSAATVRTDAHEFTSYAHSMMVDYRGRVLNRAFEHEQLLFAEFDFYFMDTYRQQLNYWQQKRSDVYETKYMM